MDIIYQAMFFLLNLFKGVVGSYALAIIALTASLRLILWPLNTQQTRSMKKMQELQPKIKDLQAKFKDNPQKMQQEMMKFYGENKFNPFSGCLPMIIQLPIFIGLYGMLVSPDFLAAAGPERFFFIDNLAHTLFSHAGESLDEKFQINDNDTFITASKIDIHLESGSTVQYKIRNNREVLNIQPKPMIPGEPVTIGLKPSLIHDSGLSDTWIDEKVKFANLTIVNDSTKEVEKLKFMPTENGAISEDPSANRWGLTTTIQTTQGDTKVNLDVLYLVLLYAIITVLYQRVMTPATPVADNNPQAKLMKLMPLFFVGFLVFLPIPAGVILYLVVTMLLMFIQTWWVNYQDKKEANGTNRSATQVIDIKAEG